MSVAWAGYLGLAIACGWDSNWEACKVAPYSSYFGPQGFDDMDEQIIQYHVGLSLDSVEAHQLEVAIRSCARLAVNLIYREQIEPQSPMAFHVFARACKVMYRMGAAIQLKRLGYKFEEMLP